MKKAKYFSFFLVLVVFLFVFNGFAQEWISFDGSTNHSSVQSTLSCSNISIEKTGAIPICKISFAIPGANLSFPSDNGLLNGKFAALTFLYDNIRVFGYNVNGTLRPEKLGQPDLPFIRIQVRIPNSVSKVKIDVANTNFVSLDGKYLMAPIQQQLFESFIPGQDPDDRVFMKNETIYSENKYFQHPLEHEIVMFNEFKILEIKYSPIKYNPVTGNLLTSDKVQLMIKYLDGGVDMVKESNIFSNLINKCTFDGVDGQIEPEYVSLNAKGKVVVVSHQTLLQTETYKEWKKYRTSQGFEFIEELDARNMNASSIESKLKSIFRDSQMDYVVIVGDWTLVPIPTNGSKYHYKDYSWLKGSDKIPDVGMGILLADNETKLRNIVNKIKSHEKGGAWSRALMMTASIEDSPPRWNRFSSAHYVTPIWDKPNEGYGYLARRVYKGKGNGRYTEYGGGYGVPRKKFESWTQNPNPFYTNSTTMRNKVAEYWNKGVALIGHRDHGSTSGPSPMNQRMFDGQIKHNCSPLFTSLNCSSGNVKKKTSNFTYQSQTKQFGTCATISATVTTMSGDNDYNHVAMYELMFPKSGSGPQEKNVGKVFLAGMIKAKNHGRTYFHIWGDPLIQLSSSSNPTNINTVENANNLYTPMIRNSKLFYNVPYNTDSKTSVSITLYNPQGKLFKTLVKENKPGGTYTLNLKAVKENLASGSYMCKIIIGNIEKSLVIINE